MFSCGFQEKIVRQKSEKIETFPSKPKESSNKMA